MTASDCRQPHSSVFNTIKAENHGTCFKLQYQAVNIKLLKIKLVTSVTHLQREVLN